MGVKSNYWIKKKLELFCVILFFGIFVLHFITYLHLMLFMQGFVSGGEGA